MPHRRPVKKGSFGSHFDEMVKHFPPGPWPGRARSSEEDRRDLEEKCDIHAMLFERAWGLDEKDGRAR